MDIKSFWKTSYTAFMLKNLIAAVLVVAAIVVALVLWMRRYTMHGVEVEVPDVVGMYIEEAGPILEAEHLKMVIIDSTYSNKVPLGSIVEQNPVAYAHAKYDRPIYVIMNARNIRQIPLPDLHDVSTRQAEATLRSLGIRVEETLYEPSEYRDLVLDIRRDDISLEPGTRIAEGSAVTLVVGRGQGTEIVNVPNLQGRTLTEARSLLLAHYLILGATQYSEPQTDENADQFVVYAQDPMAGKSIQEGSRVNIWLSTDVENAIIQHVTANDEPEEDFF